MPTPVVHSTRRKTTKFWRKQYGINVDTMHFIDARGMLPRHPSFTASKLLVKGFANPSIAGCKAKREIVMQRLYTLLAPDMAVPIARQRDENGKAKNVLVMRWVKGVTPSVAHTRGKDILPTDLQKREYGAMQILDRLTDNCDRHAGNYVYSKEHLHPIDHEMAFYDPLPSTARLEYSIKQMSQAHLRGALWMLDNVKKNARQVARWLHLGYYCERSHSESFRVFTAKKVENWVDEVRVYVLSCLKQPNHVGVEW